LHALDGSGRASSVNFFTILGGAILLLAWFNYISLSTARFLERMKEVGIRKLVGASRKQLILQLLSESSFFNLVSFTCAIILFLITWPWLAQYLQIAQSQLFLYEPISLVVIPVAIVISTLFSGLYPSLFLSSFKPLQSVKGSLNDFTNRSTLRKTLVTVQLAISVILITSIFAIERQLDYMRSQNIGIAIDQTVIIEEPLLHDATTIQKFEPFKTEILRVPSVTGVTYASTFAASEIDWHRTDITLGAENAENRYDSRIIGIGTEFLDVFDLKLISGRNFDSGREGDNRTMLINEEAHNMFGFKTFEDALGKLVFIGNRKFAIIGVVKNYHFRSFQYQVQPLLFIQGYPRNPSYAIKIGKENIAETISTIEKKWKEAYHGNVFRYHFLDEQFERQYASENRLLLSSGLTFLAVVISFLGLFGLSLYSVNRRTREIGIRKVMGASVSNVVLLLTGDFVKLAIIGGIIGVPFVYQGSRIWLEKYAYKMPVDITLFVLPVGMVILLTLITVSFQTINAARTNPVDSIKYE
jgi:putative ABC transport system permease protein